jgi:four helix bundle protein
VDSRKLRIDITNWRWLNADVRLRNRWCFDRGMSKAESKAQTLQKRLIVFATEIVKISATLPKTMQATHIGKQILRSGTAAAANYGEARGAESRSDFVHKLRIVLKELNETEIWLDLINASSLLAKDKTARIIAENEELCRIIAASIKTAGGFDRS